MCEYPVVDYEALASELLRALRGKRSQVAFARRLRYRSNVVSSWETGRTFPTAARTLWIAARAGIDLRAAFESYHRGSRAWMTGDLATPEAVGAFLREIRGSARIGDVARATGRSRYAVSRWLKGAAEPRLPDFLRLVEAMSLRVIELVAVFADPSKLPAAASAWADLAALKQAAHDAPWSAAVLRVIDLREYGALAAHESGWIAERLGITPAEEAEAVELLLRTGQIEKRRGRLVAGRALAVDARRDPESTRMMRAFWTEVALARLRAGTDGIFSYNVFSVSEADYERLRELHRAYFQELRSIVARSEPSERVLLASAQLVPLVAPRKGR